MDTLCESLQSAALAGQTSINVVVFMSLGLNQANNLDVTAGRGIDMHVFIMSARQNGESTLEWSFTASHSPCQDGGENSIAYFRRSPPAAASIPRAAALCSGAVLGAEFSSLCFTVTAQQQAEKPIFLMRSRFDFITPRTTHGSLNMEIPL